MLQLGFFLSIRMWIRNIVNMSYSKIYSGINYEGGLKQNLNTTQHMSMTLMGTLNVITIKLSYSRRLLNTNPKWPQPPVMLFKMTVEHHFQTTSSYVIQVDKRSTFPKRPEPSIMLSKMTIEHLSQMTSTSTLMILNNLRHVRPCSASSTCHSDPH